MATRQGEPQAFTLVELLTAVGIIVVLIGIGLTVGPGLMGGGNERATLATLKNADLIATEYSLMLNGRVINHIHDMTPRVEDWTKPRKHNYPSGNTDQPSLELSPEGTSDIDKQSNFQKKSIDRFVAATVDINALKKLYANFTDQALLDSDKDDGNAANGKEAVGFLELRDAWGNKLIYVAKIESGVPTMIVAGVEVPLPNPVGDYVADDFLPLSQSPYFASAGGDGKWGHANAANLLNLTPYKKTPTESDTEAKDRLTQEAADNLYSGEVLAKP